MVLRSASLLLTLLLASSFLTAQTDSVPPARGMVRYVNTRERTHPTLQDQFIPFSFDYPEGWSLTTSMENPGNFVQINPPRSLMAITAAGDILSIGPMHFNQMGTHEENMAVARDLATLLERQAASGFVRYTRDTIGVAVIDGLEGAEIRFVAQPKSHGRIPAGTVCGKFVVVPQEKEHAGFVLMMLADSGVAGVHRPEDVGVRGTLGAVLRSLRVVREPQKATPSLRITPLPSAGDTGTVHYRQTRELAPDQLLSAYAGFEFDYPAQWRQTPGKLLGNTFVQVSRVIDVRGEKEFAAEVLSVGSITFDAPNDSVRRVLLKQLAEMVEAQFGRSFVDYARASAGPVVVGGVEGYEVRGSGHQSNPTFSDVTYYLRMIVLPPGKEHGGLILGMVSCSLVDGIEGTADVGVKGELGALLRSFRVIEE